MIDYQVVEQLTKRYQTSEQNVIREYLQHLFLHFFYSQSKSENFLFKGGTALRVVYGSPRFSEDIDFSGVQNGIKYESILEKVIEGIALEGIQCELVESKATSGGWLAILRFSVFKEKIIIKNEISFRASFQKGKAVMIASDFIPAYKVFVLSPGQLVKEKIAALLSRAKSRDTFDLYFIIRNEFLRKYLGLDEERQSLIIKFLEAQEKRTVKNELRLLLPASFLAVIQNLPQRVIEELR